MSLPKLNSSPKYEMTIPSTGQKVKFRPYLIKEEKILLLAKETKDPITQMQAMVDTILSCISEDLDTSKFTAFDVEYMFTKIRSKSVGEIASVILACSKCEEDNEVMINLDEIKIDTPESKLLINLTDNIQVKMKYPTFEDMMDPKILNEDSQTNLIMNLIMKCIDYVIADDNRIDLSEEEDSEIMEFIESFDNSQFELLNDFINSIPTLKHDILFNCEKCGHENKLTFEGTADFFY